MRAYLRGLIALLASIMTDACAGVALAPGVHDATATATRHTAMQHTKEPPFSVVHPVGAQMQAARLITSMRECMQKLAQRHPSLHMPQSVDVILSDARNNNGYSAPGVFPILFRHVELTTSMSLESFNWFNMGTHALDQVTCHELIHVVTMQQHTGAWRWIDRLAGEVFSPSIALDRWLTEGLAVYYESTFFGKTGRLHSALWRGRFLAAWAEEPTGLSIDKFTGESRALLFLGDGAYLGGMHFVEYLTDRFGEDSLWQWVHRQAASLTSVSRPGRAFANVFGIEIADAFGDFRKATAERLAALPRPERDIVVRDVGQAARLAACAPARLAAVASQGLDAPFSVDLYDGDGRRLWRQPIDIGWPGGWHKGLTTDGVSGMEFDHACSKLTLSLAESLDGSQTATHLWQIDVATGAARQLGAPFEGLGGSVHPDGTAALRVVTNATGETSLVTHAFTTGDERVLWRPRDVHSLGAPVYAPGGERAAVAGRTHRGFNLFIVEPTGDVWQLTDDDGFNYAPRWRDAHHLVFCRGTGETLQVFEINIESRALRPAGAVPFAAIDPHTWSPTHLAVLSAEGTHWNLERIAAPSASAPGTDAPTPKTPAVLASIAGKSDTDPVDSLTVPYSVWPSLTLPAVHTPYATGFTFETLQFGAMLGGQDKLAWHRYGLLVGYHVASKMPVADVQYLNSLAAPWRLRLRLQIAPGLGQREATGVLRFERAGTHHGITAGLEALYLKRGEREGHLAAAHAALSLRMATGTVQAPKRSGLGGRVEGRYLREMVGSPGALWDATVSAWARSPVPWGRRHSIETSLWSRGLFGKLPWALEVGNGGVALPWGPLGLRAPLRGQANTALTARRLVVGELAYLLPVPVERGITASRAAPAFFIHGYEVTVFANTAALFSPYWAAPLFTAGASLCWKWSMGAYPMPPLTVQVAYTWGTKPAFVPLVGIGTAAQC